MEQENERLRQGLFNLNKLFAERFKAVQLNEAAQLELADTNYQLSAVQRRLDSACRETQALQKLVSDAAAELLHTTQACTLQHAFLRDSNYMSD